MKQEVTVETIKALEPNKVYFVEVKDQEDSKRLTAVIRSINAAREIAGLQRVELPIIVILKRGRVKFMEAPEGYEVVKKDE